jgi:hypothetical protein
MAQVVVVGLLPLEPICVGFMVDKVALGQFASVWYPSIIDNASHEFRYSPADGSVVLQLDRLLIL